MNPPPADTIYQQLLNEHPEYAHPQQPTHNQEHTMSLTTIEADVRSVLTDVVTHAEEVIQRGRTLLDERLPELASIAQTAEQSPLVRAALAAILPANVEADVVDLLAKLTSLHAQAEPQPEGPADTQPEPEAQPVG